MSGRHEVLIAGGAGIVGSAVVRHIIDSTNDQVIDIDKLIRLLKQLIDVVFKRRQRDINESYPNPT